MLKQMLVGMTSLLWLAACDPLLDLGTPDAGESMVADAAVAQPDAGIPVGGWGGSASLNGTAAFEVQSAHVYAQKRTDGSFDLSRLTVVISDVMLFCRPPNQAVAGPGKLLVLDAMTSDGTAVRGNINADGSNLYISALATGGGFPTITGVAPNAGSFTLQPEADITMGATGTVNATFPDGTTVSGIFNASFCSYTP